MQILPVGHNHGGRNCFDMEQEIQRRRIRATPHNCLFSRLISCFTCGQVYGTAPNDFLASSVAGRNLGKVFSVGEGEGRNACFLAQLPGSEGDGADESFLHFTLNITSVHCIDASEVGVAKTLKLASEKGVLVHASQGADFYSRIFQRSSVNRLFGRFGFGPKLN